MNKTIKTLTKLNKLSLPIVILIASLIIGGFYYASEVNKQRSIERQQQTKIEQEKQEQRAKDLKEQEVKNQTEKTLNTCLANAEENSSTLWDRECKYRGLKDDCSLPQYNVDRADVLSKIDKNECFKQYLSN